MVELNFSNVEELIFYNTSLQNKLSKHLFGIFEQWRIAQRFPFLRETGKQAVLDFLNNLSQQDIEILESHFKQNIVVQKMNYDIVYNIVIPLEQEQICQQLCNIEGFYYFSVYRDHENLYATFWR